MEVESLVERLNGRARELLFSKVEGLSRKVRVMELLMDWISYRKSIKIKEKSWKSKIQWLVDFDGKMTALWMMEW